MIINEWDHHRDLCAWKTPRRRWGRIIDRIGSVGVPGWIATGRRRGQRTEHSDLRGLINNEEPKEEL